MRWQTGMSAPPTGEISAHPGLESEEKSRDCGATGCRVGVAGGCQDSALSDQDARRMVAGVMTHLFRHLQRLESRGQSIKAAVVGCGFMGCGIVYQLARMPGMSPA